MQGGICIAEVPADMTPESITARSRARQAVALQSIDKRVRDGGKSRTQIAAALGLGYDQYARYVNGDTPLRFEQIELFASVYGVDPHTLGQAILTGDASLFDAPASPFDFEAALQRLEPIIPEHVAQAREQFAGAPELGQRAAIDVLETVAAIEGMMPKRSLAKERAEYEGRRTGA